MRKHIVGDSDAAAAAAADDTGDNDGSISISTVHFKNQSYTIY